jgi:hypothetical protein
MQKRGAIDVLKRALDDTIANWPLVALRLGEALVFAIIAIAAIFIILVPIAVSIGISASSIQSSADIEQAIAALLGRWMLLVWVFVAVLILAGVFVAMHSFVEAGGARVYVDAERVAGPANEGPRQRFRVFSMDKWMAGGLSGWWTVFWIYNLAWGLAGLILLIPLIPTAALMVRFSERPEVLAGIGCLGIVVTLLLGIVVAIVTGIWTNRAIVDWAANGTGARASLSSARQAIRIDLGRHVLVTAAAIVIGMAGSSFFASFSFFAAFGQTMDAHSLFNFVTMPIRLIGSLGSTAFSAAVTSWYVAAYAALAVEK